MAKQTIDYSWEIKKLQEQKKTVLGTERTLKLLRVGKVKKVYVASNAPQTTKESLSHYNLVSPIDVVDLPYAVDEVGTICKRPFPVALIGVLD